MSGTRCESRLPGGRSPWSTCLVPKQLHTPKINKGECEIPTGNLRLMIDFGRSLVMAIFDRIYADFGSPAQSRSMHDQSIPRNSRS